MKIIRIIFETIILIAIINIFSVIFEIIDSIKK